MLHWSFAVRRILAVGLLVGAVVSVPRVTFASTATMPLDSDLNNDGQVRLDLGSQAVKMHAGTLSYDKPLPNTYHIVNPEVKYTNLTAFSGIKVKDQFFLDGVNVLLGRVEAVAKSPTAVTTLAANETRVSRWLLDQNFTPYSSMSCTARSKYESETDWMAYLKTNGF